MESISQRYFYHINLFVYVEYKFYAQILTFFTLYFSFSHWHRVYQRKHIFEFNTANGRICEN